MYVELSLPVDTEKQKLDLQSRAELIGNSLNALGA